ncbi:HYR domain-containing protein, partial [Mariniphaga anaerophila]
MRKFYLLLPFFLLFSAFSFGQESNRINDGSPGFYDSLKGKTLPLFTKSATIGTKSAMAADEALVYVDYALANDGVVDGLTALGYTVTIASSWNDFSTQLASGDFGIAVAFAQDNGAFGNGFDVAAAENYISSGGKMVFATWNSGDEPIANLFEAHLTGNSNRNTVSITDTDIASGITNPFSLANPGWGIYSLGLEPLGGGEMLATFENGEAAMVLGNSGQTIMLGYLSDTPPAAERQAIFENVVKKLAGLCNEDIVVDNDEGQCGAVVTYDAPTADGAVVTQIDDSGFVSGDEFPVGETTQEFEFDYGGGDKDTCSFTVTVNDVEFPVIDCPANIVIENDPGEGGAVVWYSATQNFTGEFAPENWTLETNGGNGDVDLSEAPGKITLWGSDGDSGSEIFTEYKITIPADGSMSFTWNYLTLDEDGPSFDPFGYSVNGNYMQLSYDEGGIMQEDSETIALNAGDEFSFFVWTEDDVAGAGSSAVIDFVFSRGGVEVTDNCPGTDWAANYESGSFFPIGETEVVLTATDASGNTSTCSFAVTVNDTEGAEVVANPIDVYLDETGGYTLAPEDLEMMADGTTDNYTPFEELELSAYPHIFNCGQVGEPIHTRLTVEDNEGNISRAWTVVTVYDTIAPVFAPVADVEIVLEPGVAETAIEYPAIEVTDNCMPTPELIEG